MPETIEAKPRLKTLVAGLLSPQSIATIALLIGVGLFVAGVYLLAGAGWALIAGAVPLLLLAVVLIRGLINAG